MPLSNFIIQPSRQQAILPLRCSCYRHVGITSVHATIMYRGAETALSLSTSTRDESKRRISRTGRTMSGKGRRYPKNRSPNIREFWNRGKSNAPAWTRSPDRPVRRIVPILTMISGLSAFQVRVANLKAQMSLDVMWHNFERIFHRSYYIHHSRCYWLKRPRTWCGKLLFPYGIRSDIKKTFWLVALAVVKRLIWEWGLKTKIYTGKHFRKLSDWQWNILTIF